MSQNPIQEAIDVLDQAARALAGQASELDALLESTPTSLADSLEGIDDKIASRVTGALDGHLPAAEKELSETFAAVQQSITRERHKLENLLAMPGVLSHTTRNARKDWDTFDPRGEKWVYKKNGPGYYLFFVALCLRLFRAYLRGSAKGLNDLSEALGEAAGFMYLAQMAAVEWGKTKPEDWKKAGDPALLGQRDLTAVPEKPWKHAVAFEGSGVVNLVWWDGKTLRIVECKGGTSRLATRDTSDAADKKGHRAVQGSQVYLKQIAILMSESPDPVKKRVGNDLLEALEAGNVDYVVVSAKLDQTVTVSRAYWDHPGWALAEQTERQPRGARS